MKRITKRKMWEGTCLGLQVANGFLLMLKDWHDRGVVLISDTNFVQGNQTVKRFTAAESFVLALGSLEFLTAFARLQASKEGSRRKTR